MSVIKKRRTNAADEASILSQRTKGERVVYGIVFAFFLSYALIIAACLLYLLITSFLTGYEYNHRENPFVLPEIFQFKNYIEAMGMNVRSFTENRPIYLPEMFFNSVWYCVITVAGQLMMSNFTGYVFSKYKFRGRAVMYAIIIFCMTIPIVGTTGAMFKFVNTIGIYNTPFYPVLTSLSGIGFNFMVMYGFYQNVSWSYAEAVFLDGGGHFSAYTKVMLPQAKMAIVTLGVVAFIQCWNNYETSLLMLPDFPTVASGLQRLKIEVGTRGNNVPAFYAGLVLSMVPIVVLFASCSDIIMKNLSIGGLKG